MEDQTLVALLGIIALLIIESIALMKGFDGQLFLTTIGAIFGIVGYAFGKKVKIGKKK